MWRKIKLTPSLVFLFTILTTLFIYFITMGGFYSTIEILSVFLLIGIWCILLESFSYYLVRKKSDIYKLKAIDIAQDGFLVFFRNSSVQKQVLFKNIIKLSFAGYNPLAKTNIWYMHYVIEFKDMGGEKKEMLIPLDISNLPEFLKTVIQKAGLIKVRPSQFSPVFEWRKPIIRESLKAVENNDLNPCVIDPNKNLFS